MDEIARQLEQRWGIGRLERLAPPELAVKFAQARQNFNDACDQDDHNYLVQKANNLVAGWKALEKSAERNGHDPADPRVWYFHAPSDALGGKPYAIVEQSGDHTRVDPDTVMRVYSLDEICRIIAHWEASNNLANATKDHFPGAEIKSIEVENNSKEFYNDEIPF
ncbi:MAG: hypothetical protein ACPG4A_06675 [Pseudomonadales bacterium]